MATYEPSREGLKQLRKDLKHGVTLYATLTDGLRDYRKPFTFTGNRLTGYVSEGMSDHYVLLHYGPLYGAADVRGGAR